MNIWISNMNKTLTNIQFFDEAGIKLSQDLTPRFGHALRGTVNEQLKYNVTCDLLR